MNHSEVRYGHLFWGARSGYVAEKAIDAKGLEVLQNRDPSRDENRPKILSLRRESAGWVKPNSSGAVSKGDHSGPNLLQRQPKNSSPAVVT
jgi:hypothetical protein